MSTRRYQKKSERELKRVSSFSFFNRFGIVGEYLKLELKSNLRNKAIRSRMIMSLALVVIFSLLIAYTSFYDNPMMTNYCASTALPSTASPRSSRLWGREGNYIDLLMVHP